MSHLEPVSNQGPTPGEMAEATDESVKEMLEEIRCQHPNLKGAAVSGAVAAVVRFHLQAMPDGTTAQQVLEVFAPMIRNVAVQIVEARRIANGKPPPASIVEPLHVRAFKALQAELQNAPIPTFVIQQGMAVHLVSLKVADEGTRSHASTVSLTTGRILPAVVVAQHCQAALDAWGEF